MQRTLDQMPNDLALTGVDTLMLEAEKGVSGNEMGTKNSFWRTD